MKRFFLPLIALTIAGCATTIAPPSQKAPEAIPDARVIPAPPVGPKPPRPRVMIAEQMKSVEPGSSGDAVKTLQEALVYLGAKISDESGNYGRDTEVAAKEFQSKNGIYPSGLVGPQTWGKLRDLVGKATDQEASTPAPENPSEIPPVAPKPVDDASVPKMSWDNSERRDWSIFTYKLIREELLPKFKKMKDGPSWCSKWGQIDDDGKAQVLTEAVIAIAKYESGWIPTSKYYETTMGYYSQGLLQLSYPDVTWAKFCEFDEKKDAGLPVDSPLRTINDPKKNLNCGVRILANLTESNESLTHPRGGKVYWAVIIVGGKYQKISAIQGLTKSLAICQ